MAGECFTCFIYIRPSEGTTKHPVFCNNETIFDPDAIMVSNIENVHCDH